MTKSSNDINTHSHPFPHTLERPSGANIQLTLDKLFHQIVNPESEWTMEFSSPTETLVLLHS